MKSLLCSALNTLIFLTLLLASSQNAHASVQTQDETLRQLLLQAIKDTSEFEDRFSGEVWLMDMSNRLKRTIPDDHKRIRLLKLVYREARRANLDPELVLAVIQVESNFDRWAISRAGARGLMQIMPFWLNEIGRPNDNLFNPATNLRFGCTILRHYLDIERGNLTRALARYNGSLGSNRYPNLVYAALRKRWFKQ